MDILGRRAKREALAQEELDRQRKVDLQSTLDEIDQTPEGVWFYRPGLGRVHHEIAGEALRLRASALVKEVAPKGTKWYCRWTQEGNPPPSPAAEKRAAADAARRLQSTTHSHVRRARELAAEGNHSSAEWELKLAEFGGCCAYCGAEGDMHRDHFVPISRGGSNAIANIVPACPTCNMSKGAKTGAEFIAWLRNRVAAGRAA